MDFFFVCECSAVVDYLGTEEKGGGIPLLGYVRLSKCMLVKVGLRQSSLPSMLCGLAEIDSMGWDSAGLGWVHYMRQL